MAEGNPKSSGRSQHGYKVHAEIHLLFDYEDRQDVMYPPQILKSRKYACFSATFSSTRVESTMYLELTERL
jgi:hypothetical protein